MFGLFTKRRTLAESGVFSGMTDWHCHLLPGVDDGVQTMEESLRILSKYEELGIREVWLTPHIMEDFPNKPADLRNRFSALKAAYAGDIKLHLAAENMIDNVFEERLKDNELLPLGEEGINLLVETSYFNPPIGLKGTLQDIKTKGYYPILAHPERYFYMEQSDYKELKSMGVKFQMNLFSLVGAYGPAVKEKAEWLYTKGMIDIFGTDTHRLRMLDLAFNVRSKFVAKHLK